MYFKIENLINFVHCKDSQEIKFNTPNWKFKFDKNNSTKIIF